MTVHYEIPVEKVPVECERCGREAPGHHLGCANARQVVETEAEIDAAMAAAEPVEVFGPDEVDPVEIPTCLAEGCQDAPKPYGGRGPRPKYCAAHGK